MHAYQETIIIVFQNTINQIWCDETTCNEMKKLRKIGIDQFSFWKTRVILSHKYEYEAKIPKCSSFVSYWSAVTGNVSPKKLRQVSSKLFLEYLNEQGTNRFSSTFLLLRQRVELKDSTDRSKNFDPVTCFTLRNNEWKSRPERRPCHRLLGILHCLTLRRNETKSQKRKQRRNSGEICSESKRVLDRFSANNRPTRGARAPVYDTCVRRNFALTSWI